MSVSRAASAPACDPLFTRAALPRQPYHCSTVRTVGLVRLLDDRATRCPLWRSGRAVCCQIRTLPPPHSTPHHIHHNNMSTPGREDPAAHRNLATATRAAQESTATGDNAAPLTVVPRLDHPGSLNPSNSTTPLGHDDHGDLDPAASLSNLPPELLDLVLSHVEPEHRTRTALSLAIATGHSPSQRAIWKHVVVNRGPQLMPLWKKLMLEKKKGRSGGCELARTFSQVSISRRGPATTSDADEHKESWRGDADILNK